jgi:hypothetical protein
MGDLWGPTKVSLTAGPCKSMAVPVWLFMDVVPGCPTARVGSSNTSTTPTPSAPFRRQDQTDQQSHRTHQMAHTMPLTRRPATTGASHWMSPVEPWSPITAPGPERLVRSLPGGPRGCSPSNGGSAPKQCSCRVHAGYNQAGSRGTDLLPVITWTSTRTHGLSILCLQITDSRTYTTRIAEQVRPFLLRGARAG